MLAPDEVERVGRERQSLYVRQQVNAARRLDVGLDDSQSRRTLPSRLKRPLRREDERRPSFRLKTIFIFEPQREGPVPRVAVAARALDAARRAADLQVVVEAPALPAAARARDTRGQKSVRERRRNPRPHDAQQERRRDEKAMFLQSYSIPCKHSLTFASDKGRAARV